MEPPRAGGLAGVALLLGALLVAMPARAQERPPLYINEVIADNRTAEPIDIGGGTPDIVEIYNAGDSPIVLGTSSDRLSYYLSDSPATTFDPLLSWRFPSGRSTVPAKGFLIVFCDGNRIEGDCELHASFNIDSNGDEPLTLWGPEGVDGQRQIVDRVWLPPLRQDTSMGRHPDGAGPAPVPERDIYDTFVFHVTDGAYLPDADPPVPSPSPPTFGSCQPTTTPCLYGSRRDCQGAPNGPGINLDPRISMGGYSTSRPAAGEAVWLLARVRDDASPVPASLQAVEVRYRVIRDGTVGDVQVLEMTYDGVTGVKFGDEEGHPSDRWTQWEAEIPGQDAGSRVEFHFYVRDGGGLESTRPLVICADGIGPCDREFGGPGCERDLTDVTCTGDGDDDDDEAKSSDGGGADVIGERYIACDGWYTYTCGYTPRPEIEGLVINEVVPLQYFVDSEGVEHFVLEDTTHCDPTAGCEKDNDFIELYNGSASEIDLSGLWLSDSTFRPVRWQFPAGSRIAAGQHLIVWCDNDGAKCPDPLRFDPPCFWECPDPTDPSAGEYHTNFALAFEGEQIYLHDLEEHGFGVIHGIEFAFTSEEILNRSVSLIPDGDVDCVRISTDEYPPTPRLPNAGEPCATEPEFRRGDANTDGAVDLSDGVFILNYLFTGGRTPDCFDAADTDDNGTLELTDAVRIFSYLFLGAAAPPSPGPDDPGPDPSDDGLPPCVYP
ncbi:MAG: lamin tail domain-containing protein [Planctomycetes bacterium]|nr:lamin tail domain-containing protein [Planctomycetota bacterium]